MKIQDQACVHSDGPREVETTYLMGHSIVAKYDKPCSANKIASSLNYVKQRFEYALEYTGISENVRGLVLLVGLSVLPGIGIGVLTIDESIREEGFGSYIFLALYAALTFILIMFVVWTIRFELFRPLDEPIIFDRKHRKIFRLCREVQPGLRGLARPWPMQMRCHDWNLTDALHTTNLVTSGSNAMLYHHLRFVVRKSASDATIVDSFAVGNSAELGEATVPLLWEHIRRFMEEDGPHLPPTEQLFRPSQSTNLWTSMGCVGPFGKGYMDRWRTYPKSTVFFHLISPFLLPFNFVWGMCHWLSYCTASAVHWPAEVLELIGPPLQPEDVKPAAHPSAAPDIPAPPAHLKTAPRRSPGESG